MTGRVAAEELVENATRRGSRMFITCFHGDTRAQKYSRRGRVMKKWIARPEPSPATYLPRLGKDSRPVVVMAGGRR